jgi:uncharacterized protein
MRTSKRTLAALGVFLAAWAAAAPSWAASFPCEKAGTAAEKLVCQDGEVSVLDEVLGRRYAAARTVLKAAQTCLAEDQRVWLLKDRAACTDSLCMKRVYQQRLAQLDGLQPGASANRNMDLPAVPVLMWVVPPVADSVAAARDSHSRRTAPLAVRGKLLDEVAGGDGFVLQTAAYTRHLIVPLMFLEADTARNLSELAKDSNARFEVLGSAAAQEPAAANAQARPGRRVEKGPHFELSRCTFIYRLPANQSSNLPARGVRP